MSHKRISVVTPSFNQGSFVEETILSVVGQMYPNLEYIVIDGGSTDQSVEIIKKYEKYITYWISEPDNGQAQAINKGFSKATGDILCWLNSDDMYFPGILHDVGKRLNLDKPELLFGNALHFNDKSEVMWGSSVSQKAQKYNIEMVDYIIQPATFWTRKALELAGQLNEDFHYGFDWEWFVRAKRKGVHFVNSEKYYAIYRIHEEHKSGNKENAAKRRKELLHIYDLLHKDTEIQIIADKSKNHKKRIRKIQYYLKKFRLLRYERYIFSILYPSLFLKHPYSKVMDVMKMV